MSLDSALAPRLKTADFPRADALAGRRQRLLLGAGLYLALWLSTRYSAQLLESAGVVSLWFLPAGLRFFCVLVLGWPGVLLELAVQCVFALLQIASQAGAPVAELLSTNTLWRIFNLLGSLAANAAVILPLRRKMGDAWDLARPGHGAVLVAAALATSALAALAVSVGNVQLDLLKPTQFSAAFSASMIGDFVAIVTLTPLLLVRVWPRLRHYLASGQADRRRRARPSSAAADRQTLLIVAPALLLFAVPWQLDLAAHFPLMALLLLLPLAAVALRCGQRGTVLAVPVLDLGLIVLLTVASQRDQALPYQVVVIAIALVGLWLGGAVERIRRSEAARRESEQSFRATFEQAAVGIAMVATDGRILRANQTLCDIVGYPLDALQGKIVADITHPSDRDIDIGKVWQVLSGKRQSYTLEKRYRRQDGRFVWARLTVSVVRRDDGSADYFIAVIEDIDSRKASEQALRVSAVSLQEAQRLAAVGNWRWNLASGEHIWSEELYRLYGRAPDLPPLPHQALQAYFTPASWNSISSAMKTCLARGTAHACDAEIVRPDGTHRWITSRVEATRDANGTIHELHGTLQDISERKQAAEALRELNAGLERRVERRTAELNAALAESQATRQRLQIEIAQHQLTEARLHSVQSTLNHATRIAALGAWSVELHDLEVAENNPITWSAEMYELMDYSPEALPTPSLERFFARIHPADRAALMDFSVSRHIAQGAWQREYRLGLDDGRERLVSESAEVVFDAMGKPTSIHGAVKDITEQRQSEARLAHYRDHLEEMVSERTAKLAVGAAEQRRLNRALRLLSDSNITLIRATNEQQLLTDQCRLVVESGRYLGGWIGFVAHDPAKSIKLVAHSDDAQEFVDNLKISWDGEQEIGRGPTGTAIRTATTQIAHDCQTSAMMRPWREVIIKRGVQSTIALPLIVDGQVLGTLSLHAGAPQAFNGEEVGVLEELASSLSYGLQSLRARQQVEVYQQQLEERVARRTHEIAQLNAELEGKASDAQAASRAKSTFLSTMSHEIRTPLNAVVGLSALLADSALTRAQREYSDKIQLAARTLAALIDDVLDFSRIEAGALRLEAAPFSLDAILRTLGAVLSVGTLGKPIETLFDVEPGIPDALIGDAMRVQQILVNLAGNAAKFTERGEIVVSLTCRGRQNGQITLQFCVRDSGIGVAPEQLGPIFEAFAQAPSNRLYGGTGLGLAISGRLAALLGSRIEVTSREGHGSAFSFTVSLALGDNPIAAPDALPGLRILIIDDHPLARATLTRACAAFDWQATALDGAAAGLAELRRSAAAGSDYDLLLVDWRMPEIDGIEMLRLANATPDIRLPLVVLMAPMPELEQAIAASDDLYLDSLLAKPSTPTSLFDAVTRAHAGDFAGSVPAQGRTSRRLAGLRLLVAEDNDLNRLVVEQMLTRAGAEVVIATNGLAAVEVLRAAATPFDAVLMDIQMPLMDGYTATRIIRKEIGLDSLPIIAVTAYARPEDREKSRRAGMTGHIIKPINLDDLLDIVGKPPRSPNADQRARPRAAQPRRAAKPWLDASGGELPGVELGAALEAFGGDRRAYGAILRRFVVDHAGDIDRARQLFSADDRKGAAGLVHDICGMASIVHATEMAQLAAAAEGAIGHTEAVPALLDELDAAMRALTGSIDRIDAMAAGKQDDSGIQTAD